MREGGWILSEIHRISLIDFDTLTTRKFVAKECLIAGGTE